MFINKEYIDISMRRKIEKTKFYDGILKILLFSFVLTFGLALVLPENLLDKTLFLIPWFVLLAITIASELILIIGMIIHSIKIKRYRWTLIILFLGTIFPIIFYFYIMRKKFEKEIKDKSGKD